MKSAKVYGQKYSHIDFVIKDFIPFHFPWFQVIWATAPHVANIRDTLRDLVPFVQFKKREKHSSMVVFHVF